MSAEHPAADGVAVAVDVGGTFTDVVGFRDGRLAAVKVPSTSPDPGVGVVAGIERLLAEQGWSGTDVTTLCHATTAATNALLERTGAHVGLLVTDGFGDVLELARLRRADPFDLTAPSLAPLVPRGSAVEVVERVSAHGEVLRPLDRATVAAGTAELLSRGVESIAISFLHSYRHPAHEREAADLVRTLCGDLPVFVSHEVLPEPREYERTSTTVIAAYLGPLMSTYLRRLRTRLARIGVPSRFWVMKSGGGLVTAEHAARHPEELVESGPAAGVIGAVEIGRQVGVPDLIAFDMGGTTAKAAVIENGRHAVDHDYEVGGAAHAGGPLAKGTGHPLRVPVVDLAEVGTGGGSIAWVDEAGALRVGPRSAGSQPGPVCYGRGGTEPTVTDAYLALGMLGARSSGHLGELDRPAVDRALERVAADLGVAPAELARGIFAMATAQMSDAVRMVTVARGQDPRRFALLASGGAGPVHAWAVADDLGVDTVLVPALAGVHSAVGLIAADVAVDRGHEFGLAVSDAEVAGRARDLLDELYRQALKELEEQDADVSGVAVAYSADMRYRGQSYELTVDIPHTPGREVDVPACRARFEEHHQRSYGHHRPRADVEIVTLRVAASVSRRRVATPPAAGAPVDGARGEREVDFGTGAVRCAVVPRPAIGGEPVRGPLVLEQPDTTVIVPPGWSVRAVGGGCLEITRDPSGKEPLRV